MFAGDTESGVIHGGVVTAMLDESYGIAVQLALDGSRAIATLDLRIDYQKPAKPGLDIKAHSICYHVTRSIAFVRAIAYQETEQDPVATAAACFMVGDNLSPPLSWSGVPAGTKSLVALMYDHQGMNGLGVSHLVVYGIEPSLTGFVEGELGAASDKFVGGKNTLGTTVYLGPCPARGTGQHHYVFTTLL